jgi:hypothetical protein
VEIVIDAEEIHGWLCFFHFVDWSLDSSLSSVGVAASGCD